MSKYYIYQDTRRCIGCFSCESHCKTKNNLPIGPDRAALNPDYSCRTQKGEQFTPHGLYIHAVFSL